MVISVDGGCGALFLSAWCCFVFLDAGGTVYKGRQGEPCCLVIVMLGSIGSDRIMASGGYASSFQYS